MASSSRNATKIFRQPPRIHSAPSARVLVGAVALLACLSFTGCSAHRSAPTPTHADHIIVDKSARKMRLMAAGKTLREYRIALGGSPRGHKFRENDQRTPEGEYRIDWRNANSNFHKALHISYPNQHDRDTARALGYRPGGMIMIHGLPNYVHSQRLRDGYSGRDWTNGCIAVNDQEIDEIWNLVRDGTRIRILP